MAIRAGLAQLQKLARTLGDAERTVLNRHLNALSSLCADVQLSVVRTVFALATVDEGMAGVLDLFATRGRRCTGSCSSPVLKPAIYSMT